MEKKVESFFESLNGNFTDDILSEDSKIRITQTTEHACGGHGCGFNAGMLIR